jgi:hypothetical protein
MCGLAHQALEAWPMAGFGPPCLALQPGLLGPDCRACDLPWSNRPGAEAWPDPAALGEGAGGGGIRGMAFRV